jgi:hypothetical protein
MLLSRHQNVGQNRDIKIANRSFENASPFKYLGTGHVARRGEKRNAYRLLVGKPEGKRLLGRPMSRWVDNIRMYLGEVGWGDVDWIGLAKNRNRWRALVNWILNLRVP